MIKEKALTKLAETIKFYEVTYPAYKELAQERELFLRSCDDVELLARHRSWAELERAQKACEIILQEKDLPDRARQYVEDRLSTYRTAQDLQVFCSENDIDLGDPLDNISIPEIRITELIKHLMEIDGKATHAVKKIYEHLNTHLDETKAEAYKKKEDRDYY